MITITENTKTMLRALLEHTHHRFIARDPDGSLYAFRDMPYFDDDENQYNSLDDSMFLCKNTCTMLILDHDIPLEMDTDYFANLPVTTETPMAIQDLLNIEERK